MNKDLERKIFENFPELFPRLKKTAHYAYGGVYSISVGDGWYAIIHNACSLIKNRLENKSEMEGATLISIEDFYNEIEGMDDIDESDRIKYYIIPEFSEIKEKYGELRLYISDPNNDDYIDGILDMATKISTVTCECCGRPSKRRNDAGWIVNQCKVCFFKEKRRKARRIDMQTTLNYGAVDED